MQAMKASMPKVDGQDDDLLDDSDELPSDLVMDDDDDEDPEGGDSNIEDKDEVADAQMADSEEDADGDGFSLAEGSDEDDLINLDDDVPHGLIDFPGTEAAEDEEWTGFGDDSGAGGKRKRGKEEVKVKRKKLRSLPTFASYEDYAKMIEDAPEDNI